MSRALFLTLALSTLGCSTSGDALQALEAELGPALESGDQLAVHRTLCAFVGEDADCISEDGPVPPPPPEEADAGYVWGVMTPHSDDGVRAFYMLGARFETEDGLQTGAFSGLWSLPTDYGSGRLMGDSNTVDPNWKGVYAGSCEYDVDSEEEGVFEAGWARARYTELADVTGHWTLEDERPGGRMVGTFVFGPSPEGDPAEEGVAAPMEDPADDSPM